MDFRQIRTAAPRLLVLLLAAAVVAATGSACSRRLKDEPANLNFTLKDMNGHDVRLADYKGRALIVNFWGVECGPCRLETPVLVDLAAKYKDRGLSIVGVSIQDSPDDIRKFAAEFKVPYPLIVGEDRDDLQQAFGFGDAIPMSVFITSKGMVYGRLEGLATQAWLERQIQALF